MNNTAPRLFLVQKNARSATLRQRDRKKQILSPEEIAEVSREEREKVLAWMENIYSNEALARLSAHRDDLNAKIATLERED